MEGKGREREKRVRVEFRVIVEDEVRADYRAAHTSFLPPPSSRKITTARGKEGGGGSSRQGESKVKLHRREVRGSAELLRVLPIARRVIAKDAGGTTPIAPSPFRLGFLLLDRSDSRVLSTK